MRTMQFIMIQLLVISGFFALAQEPVEVTVELKKMSKGEQSAFTVFIPESNSKMVESNWKKFINERSFFEFLTKGTSNTVEKVWIGISNIFSSEKKTFNKNSLKVEKSGDELIVKNVIHEQITKDHVDVYARVTQTEKGVFLSSFFQYSDSVFINETNVNEDIITSLKNYIREFGISTYQKVVDDQIEKEEKVLHSMDMDLKRLENKNSSYHNSISRYESDIDKYNNNIWMANNDLISIENQITQLKDSQRNYGKKSLEYDTFKKELSDKSKDRKKGYRDIKRQKSKIRKAESNIRDIQSDIIINGKDQDIQIEIIEKQKTRIKEFENKKLNIR